MKLKTEFQDEDFSKGEVADVSISTMPDGRIVARAKAKSGGEHTFYYDCLKTLYNDWCDYEEPKGTYFINTQGDVQFWDSSSFAYPDDWSKEKQIGNYFSSREQAELVVEKLKAVKRLKDKGFRFMNNKIIGEYGNVSYILNYPITNIEEKDLDLLFCTEETD